ncbi:MAG: hypothetical protein V4724_26530 [Pseudomonadota bacterium]
MSQNIAQTIIKSGFDISLLLNADAAPIEKTFVVPVKYDDEGEVAAGFEITSKNSGPYQDAIRETTVGTIKRSQQKNKQIDGKTDEGANALYDLGEDRNMRIAVAVVVGLPGFVDKGVPVPVTPEIVKALLTKMPTWLDKIIAALEVDANFLTV